MPGFDARKPIARLRSRLTYANVTATIALFIALGGSAFAVSRIDGSDIANRSIGHKKLRKHTITRAEVNLKKLGKVRAAKRADNLRGKLPSDFAPASSIFTSGSVLKLDAVPNPTPRVIVRSSPLTVQTTCTDQGGGSFRNKVQALSTASGAQAILVAGGIRIIYPLAANTPQDVGSLPNNVPDWYGPNVLIVVAPSGASIMATVLQGVHELGSDCAVVMAGFR